MIFFFTVRDRAAPQLRVNIGRVLYITRLTVSPILRTKFKMLEEITNSRSSTYKNQYLYRMIKNAVGFNQLPMFNRPVFCTQSNKRGTPHRIPHRVESVNRCLLYRAALVSHGKSWAQLSHP